ncbi:hypothetical protein, partial [Aliivibrio fischeri]|uniref:hypothetical protein n=1 Tax=Aliivibrio fischeri TaxID=668 RepID=UPI001A7E11C7
SKRVMQALYPTRKNLMESALIGLAGVVLGALLSEYFRRKNRIEIYSQKVFDKRLAIHEELYAMFVSGHDVVSEVMTNTELSKSEREDLTSSIIFPLCQFMDRNGFYLNDYLTVQVATAYMGAEDVLDNDSDLDIASARARVYELSKITKKMILEESGVTEAFKHFSVISKSKPDSDVIKRVKELEKARV